MMISTRLLLCAALAASTATASWSAVTVPGVVAGQPSPQPDIADTQVQTMARQQLAAQFDPPADAGLDVDSEAEWTRAMVRSCVRVGDRMTC